MGNVTLKMLTDVIGVENTLKDVQESGIQGCKHNDINTKQIFKSLHKTSNQSGLE